ncbi:MAG TPA: nitrogenase component 1 [Syntrophomonas sp.]|nr:nitrogenase component 1 [Syntrophomonas sp.]
MTVNLEVAEVAAREIRLGSITGYQGTVKDLVEKSHSGCLRGRGRCFSQASSCNSSTAQMYLSEIRDAVIVNHAPVGCAADEVFNNQLNRISEGFRGWTPRNINMLNTNLNKEDTVFGADDKLRATIREARRRYDPKAIFVSTSCVAAIIGEDVKSISEEMERELGIPVAPVFCEGFKTKVWASGFDAAFHAILTHIVRPPEKKSNRVNIFQFHAKARAEITEMFSHFGLEPVFMVAQCTVEELARMSEAAASLAICGTLSTYIENALEEIYGVPVGRTLHPQGIAGIESWLRGLGEITGKEAEVEAYIARERAKALPEIEKIREQLRGHTAVVGMGPGFAHDYVRVLGELGVEVLFAASWHYDTRFDDGRIPDSAQQLYDDKNNIPISVCDQQSFEMMNVLNKLRPDIYISRHGSTPGYCIKLGITCLSITDEYDVFGYNGTINFGYKLLDAFANVSREKNMSKWLKLPYTHWWMEQNGFSLLEKENK